MHQSREGVGSPVPLNRTGGMAREGNVQILFDVFLFRFDAKTIVNRRGISNHSQSILISRILVKVN